MKVKAFISIVVYTDHRQIKKSDLNRLGRKMADWFENFEIILVIDGGEITPDLSLTDPLTGKISVLQLAWKHGVELAILAGDDLAVGDFIVEMEEIHPPYSLNLIKKLFRTATTENFDIVAGTPKTSRVTRKIFYRLLEKVSYLNLNLQTETVRIISRRALNAINQSKEKIRYRKILYHYAGLPYGRVAYRSLRPTASRTLREDITMGLEILLAYSDLGLTLAFIASVFFLAISMLFGMYTVYVYFTLKTVVAGWTTTMLFLAFGFSGVFLVIGILGKYITMILTEAKERPSYVVRSIKKY